MQSGRSGQPHRDFQIARQWNRHISIGIGSHPSHKLLAESRVVGKHKRARLKTPLHALENVCIERLGAIQQHSGLLTLLRWMALRAQIRSDAAEPEGFGGSKVEGENKV